MPHDCQCRCGRLYASLHWPRRTGPEEWDGPVFADNIIEKPSYGRLPPRPVNVGIRSSSALLVG